MDDAPPDPAAEISRWLGLLGVELHGVAPADCGEKGLGLVLAGAPGLELFARQFSIESSALSPTASRSSSPLGSA